MKGNETQGSSVASLQNVKLSVRQHRGGQYQKVFDARKRRVRGLWGRNGAFYAQLTLPHPVTNLPVVRRVRLEDKDGVPVTTLP